jgi:hypothetical protein
MAGAPPPQQPPVCEECGERKVITTSEFTVAEGEKASEVTNNQGSGDIKVSYGPLETSTGGGHGNQETETESSTTSLRRTATYPVCVTPDCEQAQKDQDKVSGWERNNDPTQNKTLSGRMTSGTATKQRDETQTRSRRNDAATGMSNQAVHDRSRANNVQSQSSERGMSRDQDPPRQSNEQANADAAEWGASRENDHRQDRESRRGSSRRKNSRNRSENTDHHSPNQGRRDHNRRAGKQATADTIGWGADDPSRSNEQSTEQQNNFQDALDMTDAETTAQGNEAFAQNVNANATNTTKQHQEDMHENLDPEAVEEDQSETVNRSRNTSYSQSRRRR